MKRCKECRNMMLDGQEYCPTCGYNQNYVDIKTVNKKKFPVSLAVIILLIVGGMSIYYLYDQGYINFKKQTGTTKQVDLLTTTEKTTEDTSYMITAKQDFLIHIDKYVNRAQEQFAIDSLDKYSYNGYYIYTLNKEISIEDEYKINGYILVNANNRDTISYTLFAYNKYFILQNYVYGELETDNDYSNVPESALIKYENKKLKEVNKKIICEYYTDTYYPCYTNSVD